MQARGVTEWLIRPPADPATRILFIARHAPIEPVYACASYPEDGGYPAYYHRVRETLAGLGYAVRTANSCDALFGNTRGVDLVFSLYNRMPMANPEIFAASACSYLGLPQIGAPANIRALAEDKWLTRLAARTIGLPVADSIAYGRPEDLVHPPPFAGPYFIKNRFGAASEGIGEHSIQDDWDGAAQVAETLMERGMAVLVEQFAPGFDITVPVLGGDTPVMLGVVRPASDRAQGIITEDLKRDDPLGYSLFESGSLAAELDADVARLWAMAGPMDYFRMDYRFDPKSGRRVFLEFNICCHVGRSGAICLAASQWGLSQADVLGHVVEYSLRRQEVRR